MFTCTMQYTYCSPFRIILLLIHGVRYGTSASDDSDFCPTIINIYIFIAITLDESIFLDVLHYSMKNIKSRDLEATPMGGATSKSAKDFICSLLLAGRRSCIAMTLSAKIRRFGCSDIT